MDALPFKSRNSSARRWLMVGLRSLHLAGVVLVGAAVAGGAPGHTTGAVLMLATGLALFGMELQSHRAHVAELAGAFIVVKLALVAWMVLDPAHAAVLFWVLLLASSVVSHAPKHIRHWRVWPGRP